MFLLIHTACECVFELGLDPMPVKLPAPLLGKRSLSKYLRAYLQLASKMHIVQKYDHVDFSVEGGLNQVKTKSKQTELSRQVHQVKFVYLVLTAEKRTLYVNTQREC